MEAKELRRIARENLQTNWWLSIGVAVVACVLGGLLAGSNFIPELEIRIESQNIESIYDVFRLLLNGTTIGLASTLGLAQFILGGVVQLGYAKYLLKQHDRQELQFKDLFSKFDQFGQGFLQAFLRGLYCFLWGLLFVIPGIVKSFSYAMTPFIMAENPDLTASEAIRASKELMHGHKGELFWLGLTFFGWGILCALTMNLGYIALNPYINAAYAAFYRKLRSQEPIC